MKRLLSLLLSVTMLFSSVNIVRAEEASDIVYNTVNVEFSDSNGMIEPLQVMIKNNNVYADAEELGRRLGYQVSISEEYVSVYNKEDSENVPYGLTVFYYGVAKAGHMVFNKMVDYETPFENVKNEEGVWIPLEHSLLLLNSSMLIVDETILIDMPEKDITDIYMDILKNNETYLFDWNKDFGYSELDWKVVGSASHIVNLFNGLLNKDGASWVQLVQMFAMDSSSYDSKYSEAIAQLFCTYSDEELEQEVKNMKKLMGNFNTSGTLGKTLSALEKSVPKDADIGALQKTCEELKDKIDGSNASIAAYNRVYQTLENACDEATLFANTAGKVMDIQKGVSNATSFLGKLYTVAEVVGYAKEFQNQDEFAVAALTHFTEDTNSQSVMSDAMKGGIDDYTVMLQTDIATYSALKYLKENYDDLIMDAADLSDSLGTEATLILIAWDLVQSVNILNIGDKIKAADKFELAMYSSIFQSDAFVSYQDVRNTTFDSIESITPENLYEVSQSCYTYLKFCYITRDAAIASLKAKTVDTQEKIQPLIDYQKSINEEIAGYLVRLKNADTKNEKLCYGFLPENNKVYLERFEDTKLLEVSNNDIGNSTDIYKDILDMYYYNILEGWDESEDVCYLFYQYEDSAIKNLSDAGYAFIDLDGNGISELLVSPTGLWGAEDGMIYDLYTYKDGRVVYLASSGERDRYYLGDDNNIYNEGSGGAMLSSTSKYVVDAAENFLKLEEILLYDGYTNEINPWFYGDASCYDETMGYDTEKMKSITEEEAMEIWKRLENKKSFSLNTFDTYTPSDDISTDNIDTSIELTEDEQRTLNVFLSNFSEQWFNEEYIFDEQSNDYIVMSDKFESENADPMEMIEFACLYLKINSSNTVEFLTYNDYPYAGFSVDSINLVTQKFFNRSVSPDDIVPIQLFENYYNYIVIDDMVCFAWRDGETYNNMTVVKEVYDLGDGSMQVKFNIYSIDVDNYNLVDIGGGIKDKSVYNYTQMDAKSHPDFEFHLSGVANLKPKTLSDGLKSYQLISYELYTER